MRQIISALFVLVAAIAEAHATAGVSCRAKDASVKFGLTAAFGRGLGGGMANFGAVLQILRGAPEDLRNVRFEREEASQVWFYDRDLKFQLHHERPSGGPAGYVDLVVETRQSRGDESLYRGGYVLRATYTDATAGVHEKSLELRGRVQCGVD